MLLEKTNYQSLNVNELDYEYIMLKSKYAHKKNIITFYLISILLAVIMNTWKYLFGFVYEFVRSAVSIEIKQVVSTVILIIAVFGIWICLYLKDLLIIENVRNLKKI